MALPRDQYSLRTALAGLGFRPQPRLARPERDFLQRGNVLLQAVREVADALVRHLRLDQGHVVKVREVFKMDEPRVRYRQLAQVQPGGMAAQRLRLGAGVGEAVLVPTHARRGVQAWQVAGTRDIHGIGSGTVGVEACRDQNATFPNFYSFKM